MSKYIQVMEVAPGRRVTLRHENGRYYAETQQHISTTNGSLPWEFDAEGWRACTGTSTRSAFDAVTAFNELADNLREYLHGRT